MLSILMAAAPAHGSVARAGRRLADATPTHDHALDPPVPQLCPETTRCPDTNRSVFLIEGGKEDGAFAQTFYQIGAQAAIESTRPAFTMLVS